MEKIINIDYMRCLKALIRKLPLAIIIAIAASILSAVACYFVLDHENEYTARASAYTGTIAYGNAAQGVQYAELAKSLTVAEKALAAIGDTSLDKYDIYDMIYVSYDNESSYVNSSSVINIYAIYTDSQTAINVANEVTKAFVAEVGSIIDESNSISVLDIAATAEMTYDAQEQFILLTAVGGAFAFFLVCFIVVLREILSLRLITVSDGTLYGKLDVIGVIPNYSELQ